MSWLGNPIKAYLTSTLQAALSKYVVNVDLEALGLLGSSGIVARDVELRLDMIDKRLDLSSSSGFIKELRINIPWTSLLSQPIVIELRTVEVVLVAGAPAPKTEATSRELPANPTMTSEGDSSWIRQTLKSILANVTVEIHNVIIKYQRDDVVLSTSLKSLVLQSCSADTFEPGSQKPFGPFCALYKSCEVSGLTVTLDRVDHSVKRITAFELPVLQRTDARARICLHLEPGQAAQPQSPFFSLAHPDASSDPFSRSLPDPWGHPYASLAALCDVWVERLVVNLSEQHVLMLDDLAHRPKKLSLALDSTPLGKSSSSINNSSVESNTRAQQAQQQPSWRSWAWDTVVGNDDDADDADLLGSLWSSSSSEVKRQALPTLVIQGICVDSASLSLVLHQHPDKPTTLSSAGDSPRSLAVPTPKGIVLVDVDGEDRFARSYRLVTVAKCNVQTLRVEISAVSQRGEVELSLLVDVEAIDASRWTDPDSETLAHFFTFKSPNPRAGMPHPHKGWSLFPPRTQNHETETPCGRVAVSFAQDKVIVDCAMGSVDAFCDPLLVEGIVRFSTMPNRALARTRNSTEELRRLAVESVSMAKKKAPPTLVLATACSASLSLVSEDTKLSLKVNDAVMRARMRDSSPWPEASSSVASTASDPGSSKQTGAEDGGSLTEEGAMVVVGETRLGLKRGEVADDLLLHLHRLVLESRPVMFSVEHAVARVSMTALESVHQVLSRMVPIEVSSRVYFDLNAAADLGIGREIVVVETILNQVKVEADVRRKRFSGGLAHGILRMLSGRSADVLRSSTTEAGLVALVDFSSAPSRLEMRASGWELDWEALTFIAQWSRMLVVRSRSLSSSAADNRGSHGNGEAGSSSPLAIHRMADLPDIVLVDVEPCIVQLCEGAEARLPLVSARRQAGESAIIWSALGSRVIVLGSPMLAAAAITGTWSVAKGLDVAVGPLALSLNGPQTKALLGLRSLPPLGANKRSNGTSNRLPASEQASMAVRVVVERAQVVLDTFGLAQSSESDVLAVAPQVGVSVDGLMVTVEKNATSISVIDARAWESARDGRLWPLFGFTTHSSAPKRLAVLISRSLAPSIKISAAPCDITLRAGAWRVPSAMIGPLLMRFQKSRPPPTAEASAAPTLPPALILELGPLRVALPSSSVFGPSCSGLVWHMPNGLRWSPAASNAPVLVADVQAFLAPLALDTGGRLVVGRHKTILSVSPQLAWVGECLKLGSEAVKVCVSEAEIEDVKAAFVAASAPLSMSAWADSSAPAPPASKSSNATSAAKPPTLDFEASVPLISIVLDAGHEDEWLDLALTGIHVHREASELRVKLTQAVLASSSGGKLIDVAGGISASVSPLARLFEVGERVSFCMDPKSAAFIRRVSQPPLIWSARASSSRAEEPRTTVASPKPTRSGTSSPLGSRLKLVVPHVLVSVSSSDESRVVFQCEQCFGSLTEHGEVDAALVGVRADVSVARKLESPVLVDCDVRVSGELGRALVIDSAAITLRLGSHLAVLAEQFKASYPLEALRSSKSEAMASKATPPDLPESLLPLATSFNLVLDRELRPAPGVMAFTDQVHRDRPPLGEVSSSSPSSSSEVKAFVGGLCTSRYSDLLHVNASLHGVEALEHWIGMQWAFERSMRVGTLVVSSISMAPEVLINAFGSLVASLYCQLLYWDANRRRWIISVDFFAPFHYELGVSAGLDVALQSFVEMEGMAHGGITKEASKPVDVVGHGDPSERWMIRWALPDGWRQAGRQDARLAVSNALAVAITAKCVSPVSPTGVQVRVAKGELRLCQGTLNPPEDVVLVCADGLEVRATGPQVIVEAELSVDVLRHVSLSRTCLLRPTHVQIDAVAGRSVELRSNRAALVVDPDSLLALAHLAHGGTGSTRVTVVNDCGQDVEVDSRPLVSGATTLFSYDVCACDQRTPVSRHLHTSLGPISLNHVGYVEQRTLDAQRVWISVQQGDGGALVRLVSDLVVLNECGVELCIASQRIHAKVPPALPGEGWSLEDAGMFVRFALDQGVSFSLGGKGPWSRVVDPVAEGVLVEIPSAEPGLASKWIWAETAVAAGGWKVLRLCASFIVCNTLPVPVSICTRPEQRWESLQYALQSVALNTPPPGRGEWLALPEGLKQGSSPSVGPRPRSPSNTHEAFSDILTTPSPPLPPPLSAPVPEADGAIISAELLKSVSGRRPSRLSNLSFLESSSSSMTVEDAFDSRQCSTLLPGESMALHLDPREVHALEVGKTGPPLRLHPSMIRQREAQKWTRRLRVSGDVVAVATAETGRMTRITLRPKWTLVNKCDRPIFAVPVDPAEDTWLSDRPVRVNAGMETAVYWPDGCRVAVSMRQDRLDSEQLPVFALNWGAILLPGQQRPSPVDVTVAEGRAVNLIVTATESRMLVEPRFVLWNECNVPLRLDKEIVVAPGSWAVLTNAQELRLGRSPLEDGKSPFVLLNMSVAKPGRAYAVLDCTLLCLTMDKGIVTVTEERQPACIAVNDCEDAAIAVGVKGRPWALVLRPGARQPLEWSVLSDTLEWNEDEAGAFFTPLPPPVLLVTPHNATDDPRHRISCPLGGEGWTTIACDEGLDSEFSSGLRIWSDLQGGSWLVRIRNTKAAPGVALEPEVAIETDRRARVLVEGVTLTIRSAEDDPILHAEAHLFAGVAKSQGTSSKDTRMACEAELAWLQVESDAPDCEMPIVLYCVGLRTSGAAWVKAERFEAVDARVDELRVNIEDETMELWARFFTPLLAALLASRRQAPKSLEASKAKTGLRRRLCVVDLLSLGPLNVMLSVKTHRTLPMLVTMRDSRLSFWPVQARRVRCTLSHLRAELAANYLADLVLSAPALLGSLDILGNPTGLVRQVAAGLHDLVALPLEELKHGWGPGAVVRGVARGWLGLFSHVAEGTLSSLSGFSGSLARNLDRISSQRQGDSTVVRQVVRGVVGVAVLPLGGVADLVERAAEGLMHSAGMGQRWRLLARGALSTSQVDLERMFNWKLLDGQGERCLAWSQASVQVILPEGPVESPGWVLCTTRGVRAVQLCIVHDDAWKEPPPTRFLCEWGEVEAVQESLVEGGLVALVLGGRVVKMRFEDAKQRRAFLQRMLVMKRQWHQLQIPLDELN